MKKNKTNVITCFEAWTSMIDPTNGIEDIYFLYRSVNEITEYGGIQTKTNGTKWFVRCDYIHDDVLMLASKKAYNAFLKLLNRNFGREGMGVIATYESE